MPPRERGTSAAVVVDLQAELWWTMRVPVRGLRDPITNKEERPMHLTDQIKTETIAAAFLLLSQVESWPQGPHLKMARELANDVLEWRRDAGNRLLDPILDALRTVPEGHAGPLEEMYALHTRMVFEHGVADGLFRRGADPETYILVRRAYGVPAE